MKLSKLVAFQNELDTMSAITAQQSADREIGKIVHQVENNLIQFDEFTKTLQNQHTDILDSFNQFEQTFNELKKKLKHAIYEAEKPWFQESYRLYDEEMRNDTPEYILNRRPALNEEQAATFRSRVLLYIGWQHPAMIIRPGLESFINDMVSCDPLYLVDQKYELLEPAISQFSELYQRRVRPYTIKESLDHQILEKIPDNQFGFCLAYNFFNFKPFEIFKTYLIEIYSKLKPGGVVALTFNDCDNWRAVDLVERSFACYTPGYLILNLAESIGYEKVFSYNNDSNLTWLELRKPGKSQTLRGGQTLARIIPKPPTEEELERRKLFVRAVEHYGLKVEDREYSAEELLKYINDKASPN